MTRAAGVFNFREMIAGAPVGARNKSRSARFFPGDEISFRPRPAAAAAIPIKRGSTEREPDRCGADKVGCIIVIITIASVAEADSSDPLVRCENVSEKHLLH